MTLNETICNWEYAIAYPSDQDSKIFTWNESDYQADNSTGWVEVSP